MYIIVESLGCTLDTNIILYVDSASIKNKKNKNKQKNISSTPLPHPPLPFPRILEILPESVGLYKDT